MGEHGVGLGLDNTQGGKLRVVRLSCAVDDSDDRELRHGIVLANGVIPVLGAPHIPAM